VTRNVASARLHLGEIPQAVTARAAGPGTARAAAGARAVG